MRCIAVLQQDRADDFVVRPGQSHELGEFVELAFRAAGVADPWPYVRGNPDFVRPTDIPEMRGDIARIRQQVGWEPAVDFTTIVAEMVHADQVRLRDGTEHDRRFLI